MKTTEAIDALELGQIKEAKAALSRRTHKAIREAALSMGHGVMRSLAIADWAKGLISWQDYCDKIAKICNGKKGGA